MQTVREQLNFQASYSRLAADSRLFVHLSHRRLVLVRRGFTSGIGVNVHLHVF